MSNEILLEEQARTTKHSFISGGNQSLKSYKLRLSDILRGVPMGILASIPALDKYLVRLAKWLGGFQTIIGIIAIIIGVLGLLELL